MRVRRRGDERLLSLECPMARFLLCAGAPRAREIIHHSAR